MSTIVIVESPYAGEVEKNLEYLRSCMADCFRRGEVPFASHGLYTQPGVLDDRIPEERQKGINGGFEIAEVLHAAGAKFPTVRAFYIDRGWSKGMRDGLEHALSIRQRVEFRSVHGEARLTATEINFRRQERARCPCVCHIIPSTVLHTIPCCDALAR